MNTTRLFFELLQVAIGNRQELSRVATPEEWEEIYEMSKKQSLAGIAFAGVERLPQEQMPPGKRIRQWAVKAEKIREHNAKVSEDCRLIRRFFEENGFNCVILKGQGNFAYYPEWLQGLRSAGDIDVWCWPKGNANDTQSEIATIRERGSLRYGASAYENDNDNDNEKEDKVQGTKYKVQLDINDNKDNESQSEIATKTKRPSDYENEDKVQGTKYKVQECKNLLNQRSALNSLNSEASAEVLNQRSVLNSLNHPVRAVIEFCLSRKRGEYVYYHNLDFPVLKATPVEVHYRPTWLYNPFRNRVLQKWFASQVQEVQRVQERAREFKFYDGYKIPSVEFNVVFQLLHLYKHIFEEGIGLRQLLDYYWVINNVNDKYQVTKYKVQGIINDNLDNRDNETQSEIATIRGCATTKRTWSATKTKRPSDYENEDKVQGTKYKVQLDINDNKDNKDNIELARSAFEPASATSDLNSLNSKASAEVLNQRSALNSLNSEASAEVLNQRAEASDLNLEPLNPSTIELITKLGLKEFAGAVMYVMREVFAMPEERMLCKPDEKRGKKLLEEILIGGNFGKYDERYNWAETTNGSMDYRGASYAFARLRHNFQFLRDYPSEVLWEPVFRVYHWVWRKCKLWKYE